MTKHEIAKAHYKGGVNNRRSRALDRLQDQLKANTKATEGKPYPEWFVLLSDNDRKRIEKEIIVLKTRI